MRTRAPARSSTCTARRPSFRTPGARATRALIIRRPVLFAVWGIAWMAGDGAIWLSVRGQRPYAGPSPAALGELTVVIVVAALITVILVGQAASGVGGLSALHRRILLVVVPRGLRRRPDPRGGDRPCGRQSRCRRRLRCRRADTAGRCRHRGRLGPATGLAAVLAGLLASDRRGRGGLRRPRCRMGRHRAGRRPRAAADGRGWVAAEAVMTEAGLDPVIHAPARLRIMVTLATLPDGDDLSFTRLQDLIGLTPGNLITHLRKLEEPGYVTTVKTGSGVTARTGVSLTPEGERRSPATPRHCATSLTWPAAGSGCSPPASRPDRKALTRH